MRVDFVKHVEVVIYGFRERTTKVTTKTSTKVGVLRVERTTTGGAGVACVA